MAYTMLVQDVTGCIIRHAALAEYPVSSRQGASVNTRLQLAPSTPFKLAAALATTLFCQPCDDAMRSMYPLTTDADSPAQAQAVCVALVAALRSRGAATMALALAEAVRTAAPAAETALDQRGCNVHKVDSQDSSSVLLAVAEAMQQLCSAHHAPGSLVPASAVRRVQRFICDIAGVADGADSVDARDVLTWQSAAAPRFGSEVPTATYNSITSWLTPLGTISGVYVHTRFRTAVLWATHACVQLASHPGSSTANSKAALLAQDVFAATSAAVLYSVKPSAAHAEPGDSGSQPQGADAAGALAQSIISAHNCSALLELAGSTMGASRETSNNFLNEVSQLTARLCEAIVGTVQACSQGAVTAGSPVTTSRAGNAAIMCALLDALPDGNSAFALVDTLAWQGASASVRCASAPHDSSLAAQLSAACMLLAAVTARHEAAVSADPGCRDLLVALEMTVGALRAASDVAASDHHQSSARCNGGDEGRARVTVAQGLVQLLVRQLTLLGTALATAQCECEAGEAAVRLVADWLMPAKVCHDTC